jgi:heat shock protein 90kDa beta
VEVPAEDEEETPSPDDSEAKDKDQEDVEDLKEETPKDSTPKTKTITKTIHDWEVMNQNKPIWTRKPTDVGDSEYKEFYKAFSKDGTDPLSWTHFRAEGDVDFKAMLFIPAKAPQDFLKNAVRFRLFFILFFYVWYSFTYDNCRKSLFETLNSLFDECSSQTKSKTFYRVGCPSLWV